jgi:hypothetical protein
MVTIPANITVTGFGMIGNPGGGTGLMAIYENSGGMPSFLLGQSAQGAIGNGVNVLPASMPLSAGSYWLMVEFSETSAICADGGTSNTVMFGNASFGSVPANFTTVPGGPTILTNTVAFNFFVVAAD